MQSDSYVRHVNCLGSVIIPKEIREIFNIKDGTPIEIYSRDNKIIIEKIPEECRGE